MSFAPDRQWFTWTTRPAEACFAPLGLTITPVLYSTRSRQTSLVDPKVNEVRFGTHALDSALSELETSLSGTRLRLHTEGCGPFAIRGGWDSLEAGEWGARFWVTLAVSAPGTQAGHDAESGAVVLKIGERWAAVVSEAPALQVTGHDDLPALCRAWEEDGYFNRTHRSNHAPVLGMRFNLDMMPRMGWAAALADSRAAAIEAARAALAADPTPAAVLHSDGALDAVRDILGWNTVHDEQNHRAYTAVSRIWYLGRFAVWQNDQGYAALLSGLLDPALARQNLEIAHSGVTPAGNIAALTTSLDAWVDRSQPPLGSLFAWLLFQRSGARADLETLFPTLLACHRWWARERDPDGTGLLSCGTSAVGEALYQGTIFAARNETGMDNSATHDEALLEATGHLSTWDLGLNCVFALDAEMLARIARTLGHTEEADALQAEAERQRALIRDHLWDAERGIFANRQRKGGFVRALAPTSFYPLLCGAATEAQTERLMDHFDDPETFATGCPMPNATRDHPAFAENTYWRGRMWPNVNFLTWLALHRAGQHGRAAGLAERGYALFRREWDAHRHAGENYNSETGEVADQGDADRFYTWAALLPMMAVEEIFGHSPWEGWVLTNGPDTILGPVQSRFGPACVTRTNGRMQLSLNGRAVLESTAQRLTDIWLERGYFACRPEGTGSTVILPGLPAARIIAARLGDETLTPSPVEGGSALTLPEAGGSLLELWFRP